MKVQRYVHHPNRAADWFWLARSYLEAAACLAKQYGDSERARSDLAPPLVFTLRHGLELFLKLLVLAAGETDTRGFNHNIHALFSKVRLILADVDESSVDYAADALGVGRVEIRKYLEALSWHVEKIAEKYHSYRFLDSPIEDEKNELFRYPSTLDGGIRFDVWNVHEKVSPTEVAADIKSLLDFLWSFFFLFGRDESGKPGWKNWGQEASADA